MSCTVEYTRAAREDLRNIYEYIAYDLLAPEAAAGQVRRIMRNINALNELPARYSLYKEEPWHSKGLRFFPVDNYLIFYFHREALNTVTIVRIMYGGRDIKNQLDKEQF